MKSRHGVYFARHGGIARRRRKRTLLWQKTEDGLFIVCPGWRIEPVLVLTLYR